MKAAISVESRKEKAKKREMLFYAVMALIFAFVPIFLKNQFYLNILIMIFFWSSMAASWNLSGGYGGQLSFGHQCFFGIGAYSSTLLFTEHGVSPWIGMLVGAIIAVIVATGINILCSRLRGLFFALSTVAFGELFMIFSIHFRDFTKGSEGIWLPFKPGLLNFIFAEKVFYYYAFLGLMVILLIAGIFLEKSKLGYCLWAIRQNEDAARSLGIKAKQFKIISFNISAFFTAICGTFYAQYILFIDPSSVLTWDIPIRMALLSMVGGIGSAFGPILGSFFMTPIAEGLRGWLGSLYSGLHLAIYGPILIWAVLFMPDGLWPKIKVIFEGQ